MEKKEKKIQEIDNETLNSYMEKIIDLLYTQASARDAVTSIVSEMSEKYGLKKPHIRKAAAILFKRNKSDVEKETDEIIELVDRCSS